MTKKIDFLLASSIVGPVKATGQMALLEIGTMAGRKKHPFVIHDGKLTDYRTGYSIHKGLNALKIERMATITHDTRTSDRRAAQIAIDKMVAYYGSEEVFKRLDALPTLNGA
jgi:hypothetical protein